MLKNWITRAARRTATTKTRRTALRLETLETREVPAVLIQIDYSRDTGFFNNNPDARAVMERVANELGNSLNANLSAIAPAGGNSWSASFNDPATGGQISIPNLTIGANTIKVFVGSRAMPGAEAGVGGFGGYSVSGTQAWINSVQTRGWSGFAPWGGSITFDNTQNWFYGQSTAGLTTSQLDFYSVATHELGHVLGIGTSTQWRNQSSGGTFHGGNATAVYGGAVPLGPDGAHWADGITVGGQSVSLDPTLTFGQRVNWSALDAAALRDLGWGAAAAAPAAVPNTLSNAQPVVLTGAQDGTVSLFVAVGGGLVSTGARFAPFAGYTGEVRVAAGDFNGDGVNDYAFTAGAGTQAVIEIIDGRGGYIVAPTAIFPGYTGGLYIAAGDIDHDGRAELILSTGISAPPIVQTYRVDGGGLQLQSSFIAFNAPWFGGGVRVAAGDLNHDGYADVVVTTASGIGAVVAYSGADLRNNVANALFTPFLLLPGSTAGLVAAVGDVDGDGYADLAVGVDRGGPPIVAVWSGAVLTQNPNTPAIGLPFLGAFYAMPANDASGVRLAMRDVDGDGRADLIATSGNKTNGLARVFSFPQILAGGGNAPYTYPLGTPNSVNGIYAGIHTTATEESSPTASNSLAPTRLDTPATGDATYTATVAPVTNRCTCPGCRVLAQLANEDTGAAMDFVPSAIAVS